MKSNKTMESDAISFLWKQTSRETMQKRFGIFFFWNKCEKGGLGFFSLETNARRHYAKDVWVFISWKTNAKRHERKGGLLFICFGQTKFWSVCQISAIIGRYNSKCLVNKTIQNVKVFCTEFYAKMRNIDHTDWYSTRLTLLIRTH